MLPILGWIAAGGAAVLLLATAVSSRRALARLRAEADAVRAERDNLAEVIGGAGEPIIVIDDQGRITLFNRAAERMFGYAAREMIGQSLERLMTERGRAAHAAYLAKTGVTAMVEAARLRTIHRGVRKRGDVFSFELAMTEWRVAGRRMFTGVLRDVTERERTADAIKAANTRARALLEALDEPLLVFEVGAQGEFVLGAMNRAAETATGWSRYAVLGAAPEALPCTGARPLKRVLLDCLSAGAPARATLELQQDGEPLCAEAQLTPLRTDTGEIDRILARLALAATA